MRSSSKTLNFKCDVNTGNLYSSIDEMVEVAKAEDLKCDTIINCTGLDARELCGDEELVSVRGILLHFDRPKDERSRDIAIFAEYGAWGTETESVVVINWWWAEVTSRTISKRK